MAGDSLRTRPNLTIVQGRAARPGTDECLLGRALVDRFAGLRLGGQLELNEQHVLTVVGVMAAQGAKLESEVWADIDAVRTASARTGFVSAVRVRLTDAGSFPAYQRAVESDPRLGVSVQRETTYLEQQAQGSSGFITGLGGVLCFLLSVGAMLGATITMYIPMVALTAAANRDESGAVLAFRPEFPGQPGRRCIRLDAKHLRHAAIGEALLPGAKDDQLPRAGLHSCPMKQSRRSRGQPPSSASNPASLARRRS